MADSPLLGGLFTASAVGGALLGVMLIFRIGDDIGRRRTLICGALLYGVGALLETLSSISAFHKDAGLTVAIVGRWVYGVACGFSMHGVSASLQPRLGTVAGLVLMRCCFGGQAPAYMAEMSPPSVRGLMVSMKEAAIGECLNP